MSMWDLTCRWGCLGHGLIEWQIPSDPFREPGLLAGLVAHPTIMATASCLADTMFDANCIDLISWEGDGDHLALAMDVHVQEGLTICWPSDAPR